MHYHGMYYHYVYPYYYRYHPVYYPYQHDYFRQPDELNIPESAKTKRAIPIGDEFFVPEFKIAQCRISRLNDLHDHRAFKISMNRAKRTFRSAVDKVKATARKWNEEINKFLGDNSAEIRRVENEMKEKWNLLVAYDCPPQQIETAQHCQKPEIQHVYAEIKALERRLRDLKSKRSVWESFDQARQTFQNNLKQLSSEQLPNVSWPENWPVLEEIEFLPVLVNQDIEFPKTLKDFNIDPEFIQNIPLPHNIENMIHIPSDMYNQLNIDALKDQIQFEDLQHNVQQVLTDLKNQAINELEKYNMCFFVKNRSAYGTNSA